jgi:hypothetical protein
MPKAHFKKPGRRRRPKHIFEHILDHNEHSVLVKWLDYKKPSWTAKKNIDKTVLDKYMREIKEKIGFMAFTQKYSDFREDWLEVLKFKIRSRCIHGLKAMKSKQATWAVENPNGDRRQRGATWNIAPFSAALNATKMHHVSSNDRLKNTFRHLLACVQALISSGEVAVAAAFKGHVAELSWQSRFYEVLGYMHKNGNIDTALFYENQQSIGIDCRVSDFFLLNRNTDFDFYEMVGELKNAASTNPQIFGKLLSYIQKRWQLTEDIIDVETRDVCEQKEPFAFTMINERVMVYEDRDDDREHIYEVFCPVPYVVWNSNSDHADSDTEDMIAGFQNVFHVDIPSRNQARKNGPDALDVCIDGVIDSLYKNLFGPGNGNVSAHTLYNPQYALAPFLQIFRKFR